MNTIPWRLLACITVCAISASSVGAQSNAQVAADSIQTRISALTNEWQALWRASDSIRIASVLVRMQADSLRRVQQRALAAAKDSARLAAQAVVVHESANASAAELTTNDVPTPPTQPNSETEYQDEDSTTREILMSLALESAARRAQSALQAKPKRGQTLSDSISLVTLAMKPDTGIASFYAGEFHGKRMSNGKAFNMHSKTCAHRWLPFGTKLFVTNLDNGKTVVVEVTDRGPFKHTRIIDVSKAAAVDLDMVRKGTARVCISVYEQPSDSTASSVDDP